MKTQKNPPTVLNQNVLLGRNEALVHSTISRLWFGEISSHKKETDHSFCSSYIFGEKHELIHSGSSLQNVMLGPRENSTVLG